jgi:hypothetical protein
MRNARETIGNQQQRQTHATQTASRKRKGSDIAGAFRKKFEVLERGLT